MMRWTIYALLLANLGYLAWAWQDGQLNPDPWADAPPPEAGGGSIEVLEVRTGADAQELRERLREHEADPAEPVPE
ncbi:hypothetical protein [Thioalkalivibrio sp. ALJ24]|uniref:hypothetical protein n=1 Tax=Thioalkalivibrio sp. ALJ24 TaxID=545276 RepID=UPI00037B9E3A|nr:hypothetical protein [Thioalkalivibrio sp. ALJ24]